MYFDSTRRGDDKIDMLFTFGSHGLCGLEDAIVIDIEGTTTGAGNDDEDA